MNVGASVPLVRPLYFRSSDSHTIPTSGTLAATRDLLQSEACDLGITRTTAHELTVIQKELLGDHRTKVGSRRRGQSLLQALKRLVESVALTPAGSARASFASQGEMR